MSTQQELNVSFREFQGREEVNFAIRVNNRLVRFTLSAEQALHMAKTICDKLMEKECKL